MFIFIGPYKIHVSYFYICEYFLHGFFYMERQWGSGNHMRRRRRKGHRRRRWGKNLTIVGDYSAHRCSASGGKGIHQNDYLVTEVLVNLCDSVRKQSLAMMIIFFDNQPWVSNFISEGINDEQDKVTSLYMVSRSRRTHIKHVKQKIVAASKLLYSKFRYIGILMKNYLFPLGILGSAGLDEHISNMEAYPSV